MKNRKLQRARWRTLNDFGVTHNAAKRKWRKPRWFTPYARPQKHGGAAE